MPSTPPGDARHASPSPVPGDIRRRGVPCSMRLEGLTRRWADYHVTDGVWWWWRGMAEVLLDDVSRVYPDGTSAVSHLSLHVRDNELMVIVGPSGCGKTTVLRLIAGLEPLSGGSISIGGRVVNDVRP